MLFVLLCRSSRRLSRVWSGALCLALALLAGQSGLATAADKQLRIGTLVPKNSLYHRQLMAIGESWRLAQGGAAKYLVYPDGSQGARPRWCGACASGSCKGR